MRPKSKTALVLAGGGLTGAVYEIGALRAIDDLLVGLSVNDFDIFVGTSAGALVNSFLANGVTPEEMLRTLEGSNQDINPIKRQQIFRLNRRDYLRWGGSLPKKVLSTWSQYLWQINKMSFIDLIWSLSGTLPSGIYDSLGLDDYVHKTLSQMSLCNDFDKLERELFIIATELDSGDRAVFGRDYLESPISLAVAASSAVPIIYKPVKINGKEYIDGGMRGAASIDLAIERGAKLVVCINPLVPFDYSDKRSTKTKNRWETGEHLSEKGVQSIFGQTLRIFSHAGLHYHIKQIRRSHPQVDIILIEPKPNDYQMFFINVMHYSARMLIAQHGFESVTYDLARDYQYYKDVLARHGVRISRRLVIEELAEIAQSNHDPKVIRRVLESSRAGCKQRDQDNPVCQLSKLLSELETILENA